MESLAKIKLEFEADLKVCVDHHLVENLRVKYLGRSGIITRLLKNIKNLSAEDRKKYGAKLNELKNEFNNLVVEKMKELDSAATGEKIVKESLDVTLPGKRIKLGHLHPLTQVFEEMKNVFTSMGYAIAEGPEIETDYYNFEALNIPKDHPARDMFSTFFVGENLVLRTHTSPVQIRVMEKHPPPIKIIAPGRVYRHDAMDLTHAPVFHQVEGLVVDEGITLGDLKGTLFLFAHKIFGSQVKIRLRPSFFPFTEPSVEIDVECIICKGKGCRVCSGVGWKEILGAGMVDPNVFEMMKIDSEKYTGFAFGVGIERVAMFKYGIDDIRLFHENDLRFLEQF
jgi:phenylalanyl-tRNA synthetase alpha chain